jgi:hypothetical protein
MRHPGCDERKEAMNTSKITTLALITTATAAATIALSAAARTDSSTGHFFRVSRESYQLR